MKITSNLILIFFPISIIFGQIDPNADVFKGIQPKWSHAAIDKSVIGYNGRTGLDWYLGSQSIIDNNSLYIVYNNSFENNSGFFIEKLNLKNGEKNWDYHYDLRDSKLSELNSSIFIRNNKLNLLNFQNSLDTFIFSWERGIFSLRTFDLLTGIQISNITCPKNLNNCPVYTLNGGFKNSTFGSNYIYLLSKPIGNKLNHIKFTLDSLGRLSSRDTLNFGTKYKYFYEGSYNIHYMNNRIDSLVSLRHNFNSLDYLNTDSVSLFIDIFDSNLGILNTMDLTNKVSRVKEYSMLSVQNKHFILLSTEYTNDNMHPRQRLDVISEDGKLVEEIVYQTRTNDPFGNCLAVLKNENEEGCIVVNTSGLDTFPYNNKIIFYKSDGKGNLLKLNQIDLKGKYQIGLPEFKITENGDILMIGLFRDYSLSINQRILSERYISTLWDSKLINPQSNSKGIFRIKNSPIYPNPVNNHIIISKIDAKFPINIDIYTETGKFKNRYSFEDGDNININTSTWSAGNYLLEIFDKDNILYSLNKIVKN